MPSAISYIAESYEQTTSIIQAMSTVYHRITSSSPEDGAATPGDTAGQGAAPPGDIVKASSNVPSLSLCAGHT